MKELLTIKEVLERTLFELKENGYGFICCAIEKLYVRQSFKTGPYATKIVMEQTLNFFMDNHPTKTLHKEFYHNEWFNKENEDKVGLPWWTDTLERYEEIKILGVTYNHDERWMKMCEVDVNKQMEQRITFLEYLISIM